MFHAMAYPGLWMPRHSILVRRDAPAEAYAGHIALPRLPRRHDGIDYYSECKTAQRRNLPCRSFHEKTIQHYSFCGRRPTKTQGRY